MAIEGPGAELAFLAGRALFALVLGYLAVGNLLDYEATVGYAESKGAPAAGITVPLTSLVLIAGALSILLGVYPLAGSLAVMGFLVAVTPVMHDFWTETGMDRQNEQIHFLKNVGLVGGALVFFTLAGSAWPYAVDLSLV